MDNSKKKNVIILLLISLILVAMLVISALLIYTSNVQKAYDLAQTELNIRELSGLIIKEKELYKENEIGQRIILDDNMIEKDRQELLTLVNPWNILPENYAVRVVDIGDEKQIDERAYFALKQMIQDCKDAGCRPVPVSGYRTNEYQSELYNNKIERLIWDGVSEEDAPAQAAQSVAVPGTSEHQLGFAIDILDNDNPNMDITQEWTPTQRWLMKNCYDYGFILRYPNETTNITGIIYEPWHYRYVGIEVAKEIQELDITFEEYLEMKGITQ